MNLVADTHALVWWVTNSKKLSSAASRALARAAKTGPVHVSAVSIFEVCVLCRRGRLELGANLHRWLEAVRVLPEVAIEPVTDEIAEAAALFGDSMSNDPADRMIVATARVLGAKLVSADSAISAGAADAGIDVVW